MGDYIAELRRVDGGDHRVDGLGGNGVPLSDRAMAIFDKARTRADNDSQWVVPGSGGAALSPVALLRATHKVGETSATPHGMRFALRATMEASGHRST